LEPSSKLSDTATYDITAWSLPYAYGVNAYASTDKLATVNIAAKPSATLDKSAFAYFVRYNSVTDAKLLAKLMELQVKLYVNEKPITQNGELFERGTLLIPKKENILVWSTIAEYILATGADATAVKTGFSEKGPDMGSPDLKFIHAPKIATIMGSETNANAAGLLWHFFDHDLQYPTTQLNAEQIKAQILKRFDVLIMPDGYYKALSDKHTTEDLKAWIRGGGRLVVIDGAAVQLANTDWGLKAKKSAEAEEKKKIDTTVSLYENRERDQISEYIPGAIYEVDLDNSHPLAFGFGKKYYTLKQNSELLETNKDGWNVGVIKKNKKIAGFAGKKVIDKLNDGTVLAVQEMGSGTVVYFMDDPMFRSFWQSGKQLLVNAVFLVGNNAVRL
jgi:hypothetical protein